MTLVKNQMRHVSSIAQALCRDEPALVSSLNFGPYVCQGVGKGPSLLIGDQSEISLLGANRGQLEYRMALLGHPGDVLLVRRRNPAFETYLADYLGLNEMTFLAIEGDGTRPVAAQARLSVGLIRTIAAMASSQGGLTLKPYFTTGHDWRLAQTIGEISKQQIHVCGPSPRITRRANDKLWFSQLARQIIGTSAIPPSRAAYGPAATAGLVKRISKIAPQVIVKIPDSAGSAGNVRLESEMIADMPLSELRRFLLARLHSTGWQDRYPVLVGVWDQNVLSSPSAQLWLNHPEDGPPRVDGIFEQHVKGEAGAFVGAQKSTLSNHLQQQLATQASQIGSILQELGYFGRCSLDAVICAGPGEKEVIHWIECNGRWGGVSIPMTAAEQLLGVPVAPALLIVQERIPDVELGTFDTLRRLDDLLYQRRRDASGLVLMSPCEHDEGGSMNFMAIASDQEKADAMGAQAMDRLGLGPQG